MIKGGILTLLIGLLSVLCSIDASAATNVSTNVSTNTAIFHPSFKSLQVKLVENDQLPPIIILDSPDRLVISFDELADDRRYMRYELIHCDRNWRPDNLVSSMFLDGFNVHDVDNYRFSQATSVNYVHYDIVLPNEYVKLKVSGNYLLRVFDESDPDDTLLQARFQVSENSASVLASVTPRTDIDYQKAHQQLSIAVSPKMVKIADPYRDFRVTVQQNGRIDDIRMLEAPMRIEGEKIVYDHMPQLIFPAGNEYRRFETVTVNYPSMNVDEMSYIYPYYHATLYTDYPRSTQGYNFDMTQHGRYRVREYNSDDPDVMADYILTHFTLQADEIPGADIFIEGDLTNRLFDPSSRMHYDYSRRSYEATLLLKQGSYNYQYLTVPEASMKGSTMPIEGNYFQTINEYTICAYYHKPGELYDRLVGYAHFRDK